MTKLAADAGIPLVYVNRQPTDVDELGPKAAFVASNEADHGTLETKEVCKLLGGKGDILVMVGDLANQAAVQRTKDIHEVIATPECSGMKILDEQTAVWSRSSDKDLMTNWISAGMKPAAVVRQQRTIWRSRHPGHEGGTLGHEGRRSRRRRRDTGSSRAMKAGDLDVDGVPERKGAGRRLRSTRR